MFLELIATIFAGFAGAGLVMLLNKLLGGRLPKWMAPVAAGLAMLLSTITSEYSWYSRTVASLPEGLAVAETVENTALYRPWTYVFPYIDRFMAVDLAGMRTNSNDPALRLTDVYFYGRWRPLQGIQIMVNCDTGQRAEPAGDGGEPIWRDTASEDPVVALVCGA